MFKKENTLASTKQPTRTANNDTHTTSLDSKTHVTTHRFSSPALLVVAAWTLKQVHSLVAPFSWFQKEANPKYSRSQQKSNRKHFKKNLKNCSSRSDIPSRCIFSSTTHTSISRRSLTRSGAAIPFGPFSAHCSKSWKSARFVCLGVRKWSISNVR